MRVFGVPDQFTVKIIIPARAEVPHCQVGYQRLREGEMQDMKAEGEIHMTKMRNECNFFYSKKEGGGGPTGWQLICITVGNNCM